VLASDEHLPPFWADAEMLALVEPGLESRALHPESSRGTSGSADHTPVGILKRAATMTEEP
jgi:hypothetical protein